MPKSHKTVGIKLLIDEATLRAIGHVAAQWAVLEIEFDAKTIVPKGYPSGIRPTRETVPRMRKASIA